VEGSVCNSSRLAESARHSRSRSLLSFLLRGEKLSRRVWDSYEAILAACKDAWLFLVTDPKRIDSTAHRSRAWINQCVSGK